jgi:adenosine deaminase
MSKTSLSNEYEVMSSTHGWTQEDIEIMNSRALKAIFDTEYASTS